MCLCDRNGTVHMVFCLEYMRCFYGRSKKPNVAGDRLTVARFRLDWVLQDEAQTDQTP